MSSSNEEDDYGRSRPENCFSDDDNVPDDGQRSDYQGSDNDNSSSGQQDPGDNDNEPGDGVGSEDSGENNGEPDSDGSDPEGENCVEDIAGEEEQDETEQLDNSSDNDNSGNGDYEARDAINVDLEYTPNVSIKLERDAEEDGGSMNEYAPQPVQTVQRQTHYEDSTSVRPNKQHTVEPDDDSDNERKNKHHSQTSFGDQLAAAAERGVAKMVENTVTHATEDALGRAMSGISNLFHRHPSQPPQAVMDPVSAHNQSHPSTSARPSKPATQGLKQTTSASAHNASRPSDDKKAAATKSTNPQNPAASSADAHEKPKQKPTKLAEPAVGKKSTGASAKVSRKE